MGKLSSMAKLSRTYTNHCIRATNLRELDAAGFEARHIRRISGHKSDASIDSYTRRLTEERKREMSDALSAVTPNAAHASVIPESDGPPAKRPALLVPNVDIPKAHHLQFNNCQVNINYHN